MEQDALDITPLFDLRLRTPRLELRLPTRPELSELRELARAGVHPPEVMPFFFPWTDEPYSEDWVVAFHEAARQSWTPDSWNLLLGTWAEGRLLGTQGAESAGWLTTRTAETGSWLGLEFQGRGYGTEMRAAIVELLWALGAHAVTSGALEGNRASARVSEKLGYRKVGTSEAAPRGTPVTNTLFRLERTEWQPSVPVAIENLAPVLQLFR
jgi:RimJ/RimL family protein N-acetyltransferase